MRPYSEKRAAKSVRKLYARRKAEGLCVRCGKPRGELSTRLCDVHLLLQRRTVK